MVPLLISDDFSTSKITIQNSKFVTQNSKTASVRENRSIFSQDFAVRKNTGKCRFCPI